MRGPGSSESTTRGSTDSEYRALTELLLNEDVGCEVIGTVRNSTQAAIRIRER
ncbi:MAG: hypothetical protein WA691_04100 [Thermoplasmata archaeon]